MIDWFNDCLTVDWDGWLDLYHQGASLSFLFAITKTISEKKGNWTHENNKYIKNYNKCIKIKAEKTKGFYVKFTVNNNESATTNSNNTSTIISPENTTQSTTEEKNKSVPKKDDSSTNTKPSDPLEKSGN